MEGPVFIVRFAKYGRVEEGPGPGYDFLIRMAECEGLGGSARIPMGELGQPVYPGFLRLSGKMILTLKVDNIPTPIILRSRIAAVLEGDLPGWPPYNTVLTLANGPIDYFYEQDLNNPNAEPVMVVYGNTVTFGSAPSVFQSGKPQISGTSVRNAQGGPWSQGQEVGGVAMTWVDPSAQQSECPIDAFRIYKNSTPGELVGWEELALVPGIQHSYFDSEFDGTTPVEYLIVHATQFPFGYFYEGSTLGIPFLVDAVTGESFCGNGRCDFGVEDCVNCPVDCTIDGDEDGDFDLQDLGRILNSFSGPSP